LAEENKVQEAPLGGAPKWAYEHFERFLDQSQELESLLNLSTKGIGLLRGIPKTIEILGKLSEEVGTSKHQTRMERVRQESELAQKEIENGFPLLHNQAAVTIWTFLEAAIRGNLCAWIRNLNDEHEIDEIKKIKVNIYTYNKLSEYDRSYFLYDLYEKEMGAGELYGTNRFEKLLNPFGLAGPLTPKIKHDIFELAQIRNVIVHRGGIADYQLVQKFSNSKFKPGETIKLSSEDIHRYFNSVQEYIVLLICRTGTKFGVDMSDSSDTILKPDKAA
jgi:hypothetical protein